MNSNHWMTVAKVDVDKLLQREERALQQFVDGTTT